MSSTVVATEYEGDGGPVMVATGAVGDFTITAIWHGGTYVELSMDSGISAYDVLNVWDYEADRARIPFTPEALAVEVGEYLATEDLLRDLGNFAY